MYKRKISDEQFVLDCVNKEFEIIGESLHFNTFKDLSEWSKTEENKTWYDNYEFKNKEQYEAWKSYYLTHFYDWKPKRISLKEAERNFSWFSLNYGFLYRSEYEKSN